MLGSRSGAVTVGFSPSLPVTVGNEVASSPPPHAASEAALRAAATSGSRRRTVISYFLIGRCGTGTAAGRVAPAARGGQLTWTESPTQNRQLWLHAGDELLDPVVDGTERVFAQDRTLRLIVQLEVHPVDG